MCVHNCRRMCFLTECYDPSVKERKVFMTVFFLLWSCILPPACSVCIEQETVWQYASCTLDRSGPATPSSFRTSAFPSWVLTAYEPSTVARGDYPATWYSSPEKAGMIAVCVLCLHLTFISHIINLAANFYAKKYLYFWRHRIMFW